MAKSLSAGRGVDGESSMPTWAVDWRVPRSRIFKDTPGSPSEDVLGWYRAEDRAHAGFTGNIRRMKVTPSWTQCLCLRGKCVESTLNPITASLNSVKCRDFPGMCVAWLGKVSGRAYDQDVKILRRGKQAGFVPVGSRPGDIACVFLGVRVPLY